MLHGHGRGVFRGERHLGKRLAKAARGDQTGVVPDLPLLPCPGTQPHAHPAYGAAFAVTGLRTAYEDLRYAASQQVLLHVRRDEVVALVRCDVTGKVAVDDVVIASAEQDAASGTAVF